MKHPVASFLLPLCALALAACTADAVSGSGGDGGDDDPTGSGGSSATGDPTGTGAGAGATTGAGAGDACPGPGTPSTDAPRDVVTATARTVDAGGQALPAVQVQLCGINICLTGASGGDGTVSFDGTGKSFKKPALKVGDGYTTGKFALLLPADTSVAFGDVFVQALPAAGVAWTPGGTATSGPVALALPVGGAFEVDDLIHDTPDKQLFRAAEVELLTAAENPAGLERVFVAAPVGTTFCPAAAVTVSNDLGWPAGSAVEFWLHGLEIGEHWVRYGEWAPIATGTVSADGTTISTDAGQGLPELSTFGLKRAL